MELKFTVKNQFGNERFFPANTLAEYLVKIMPRRSAFHRSDIEILKEAGFTVIVEQPEIKV